jgi:hypothetical protein
MFNSTDKAEFAKRVLSPAAIRILMSCSTRPGIRNCLPSLKVHNFRQTWQAMKYLIGKEVHPETKHLTTRSSRVSGAASSFSLRREPCEESAMYSPCRRASQRPMVPRGHERLTCLFLQDAFRQQPHAAISSNIRLAYSNQTCKGRG